MSTHWKLVAKVRGCSRHLSGGRTFRHRSATVAAEHEVTRAIVYCSCSQYKRPQRPGTNMETGTSCAHGTAVQCGAAGTSVPDGADPNGGILNGMAVPDGAGTGGAVAGGEVMA
jgi:hypothetical protein